MTDIALHSRDYEMDLGRALADTRADVCRKYGCTDREARAIQGGAAISRGITLLAGAMGRRYEGERKRELVELIRKQIVEMPRVEPL